MNAQPKPPTRLVVSGGPKAEPFLMQQKPGVSRGVRIWTCCAVIAAIIAAVLIGAATVLALGFWS